MARNRIVINLAQAQPEAVTPSRGADGSRSGGCLWPLLIVAIVLLLIVAGVAGGGYFWWRSYQSSPAYSLALLVDASQRNDTATIDSLLDTDKITEDCVSQVRQRLSGSLLSSLGSNQIESALSSMTPKLRETVHDEVLQELHRLAEPAAGKPFFLIALGIGQYADIKQENNMARANVNVKGEQLQLTMQQDADHWRTIAIKDDKLAQLVADAVMKNLPPALNRKGVPDEIRKQLERFLKPEQQ